MEREVSSAISLAAMLLALSVVLFIVFGTVSIGTGIREDVYDETNKLETDLAGGQIRGLYRNYETIMPKATIYSILAQEHDYIQSLSYTKIINQVTGATSTVVMEVNQDGRWEDSMGFISNTYIYPEDVMSEELNGKVKVTVDKTAFGTYAVLVENVKTN